MTVRLYVHLTSHRYQFQFNHRLLICCNPVLAIQVSIDIPLMALGEGSSSDHVTFAWRRKDFLFDSYVLGRLPTPISLHRHHSPAPDGAYSSDVPKCCLKP